MVAKREADGSLNGYCQRYASKSFAFASRPALTANKVCPNRAQTSHDGEKDGRNDSPAWRERTTRVVFILRRKSDYICCAFVCVYVFVGSFVRVCWFLCVCVCVSHRIAFIRGAHKMIGLSLAKRRTGFMLSIFSTLHTHQPKIQQQPRNVYCMNDVICKHKTGWFIYTTTTEPYRTDAYTQKKTHPSSRIWMRFVWRGNKWRAQRWKMVFRRRTNVIKSRV